MGKERHSNSFTQAQKDAILKAVLIDGMTGAQAWRAAKAGTLGMPSFDPGQRHVYTLIKRGRDQFELDNLEALNRSTVKALALAHKANLDALRALARDTDPQERARIAKAAEGTQRAINASHKPQPAPQPTTPEGTTPEPDTTSVVTSLLTKANGGARAGSLGHARTGDASSVAP